VRHRHFLESDLACDVRRRALVLLVTPAVKKNDRDRSQSVLSRALEVDPEAFRVQRREHRAVRIDALVRLDHPRVEPIGKHDVTRKQIRPALVPDAQPVGKPDRRHQQNRLTLPLKQGVSRDSRPDFHRINAAGTGQFERTLIIAEEGAYVSYLEGCTAPIRDQNQLHAAVVELVALDNAQIKYSTVQNWYPGDKEGKGGIYNFVTKRGKCQGVNSKISWTQVETGSAITWKYPSCILQGDNSVGEFYSVALTNNRQQADTGTKMIHIGKNTRSTVVSKGISAGHGQNTYRGQVKIMKGATGARNYTQCDSLLIGDKCGAHTFPYIEVRNSTARMEHEASTSKIGEDQMFYLRQRGLSAEDAVSMIVNGFCKRVFKELPMEFAVEAQKLLGVSLEGSVG